VTQAQKRFLKIVIKYGPERASNLGAYAWGDGQRKPQAYTRPASAILGQLEKQGFVRSHTDNHGTFWQATHQGVLATEEL
jgi:hypothetical protein